ncbi:MAG: hypothetical protein R3A48_02690 [Polyangiales bacterium]
MKPNKALFLGGALSVLSACGARVIVVDGVADAAAAPDVGADVASVVDAPATAPDIARPPADAPSTPPDAPVVEDVLGPGSTCDLAAPLPLGAPTPLVVRGGRETLLACNGVPPVQPTYYAVTVPAGQTLRVRANRAAGAAPVLPQIIQSCRVRACLGEPMAEAGGASSFVSAWTNRAGVPQSVVVAFGATEPGDTPFLLFAQLEGGAPSVNDVCARAEPVASGQVVTASTAGATTPVPACPGSGLQGGAARWYRATVPPGATLDAEPLSGAATLLRAYSDCGAVPACLAVNLGAQGPTLRWTNPSGATQSVVLAVSLAVPGAAGEASIRVRVLAPVSNGLCASAARLTPDVPASGVLEPGGEAPAACAGEGAAQPALFYRVRVPAGRGLSATYAAVGHPSPRRRARGERVCGGACAASSSASLDGTRVVTRWTNMTGAEVDAVVSVAPLTSAGASQDFTLTATLSTPPTNVSCEAARTVVDGDTLRGEDLSVATVVQPPCPGMAGGGATSLYYATVGLSRADPLRRRHPRVPGASRADDPRDPRLRLERLLRGAEQRRDHVLGGVLQRGRRPARAHRRGRDQREPRGAVHAVGRDSPPRGERRVRLGARGVERHVARRPGPADGREALLRLRATPGREGTALYYLRAVGAGEKPRCWPRAPRPGRADLASVLQLRRRRTASSTPSGTSAWSKLHYPDRGGADPSFAMNLTDGGATPAARANLTVSVSRPPYTVTTIPASCDGVTDGVLADAVGDDVGTASLPLPFALSYFGEPVSGWSVSTNGYLQLWPTTGRSAGALGQTELPAARAPGGMVAPFWDDLIVTAGLGDVRAAEVVAGGRHLTVQWTRAQFCCNASSADRLTFQAKLFASGVVEFHYCDLSGMTRVNGSSASIGMQDPSALRGVSYAARRADAVRTGFGLRFTP